MRKIIFAAVNSALLVVFLTACIPQTDIHQDAPTQVTVPSESAYQTEQVYQEITVEPTQSVSTVKQAMYISAYQEFVSHRLETVLSPEKLSYILHDVLLVVNEFVYLPAHGTNLILPLDFNAVG